MTSKDHNVPSGTPGLKAWNRIDPLSLVKKQLFCIYNN